MSEPKVAKMGPYVQRAEIGTYHWCTCGQSSKQPFCDGSHKGTGFVPMKVDVKEAGNLPWCGCKHTKSQPYCDGAHTKL